MLTVLETAKMCGRSPETVRRWIREEKLPATKLGLMWFVEDDELQRFLNRYVTGTTANHHAGNGSSVDDNGH